MKSHVLLLSLLWVVIGAGLSWAADPAILVYSGSSKYEEFYEEFSNTDYESGADKGFVVIAADLDDDANPIKNTAFIVYWPENGGNEGEVSFIDNIRTILAESDFMTGFYAAVNEADFQVSLYLDGPIKFLKFKPDNIVRPVPGSLNGYVIFADSVGFGYGSWKFKFDKKRTSAANLDLDSLEELEGAFDAAVEDIVADYNIRLD